MTGQRTMLLVVHTGRPAARRTGRAVADMLLAAGIALRVLEPEAAELGIPRAAVLPVSPAAAAGAELVVVIGGDGTLLRAAELARGAGVPLFGVNLGHVGFLAEAEPEDLAEAVAQIVAGDYSVQERMTVDVTARLNGTVLERTWALNEATVEKAARERMLDAVVEVDGRPLSRFGCDGVVFATPTGSTAYAFSAGGPVVWPEVEAVLMVPICAHALFACRWSCRPARCSPSSWSAPSSPGRTWPARSRTAGRRAPGCPARGASLRYPGLFCGAMGVVWSICRPARASRWPAVPARCCWPACRPARAGRERGRSGHRSPTGWWRSSGCPWRAGGAAARPAGPA